MRRFFPRLYHIFTAFRRVITVFTTPLPRFITPLSPDGALFDEFRLAIFMSLSVAILPFTRTYAAFSRIFVRRNKRRA